jgi:hypothetical protein
LEFIIHRNPKKVIFDLQRWWWNITKAQTDDFGRKNSRHPQQNLGRPTMGAKSMNSWNLKFLETNSEIGGKCE